ncbi:glycoside hydrolase [Artomyces pyxidatus]|uniref:Glycoside hydrolase n=1 Tax=Artomyces pyxidatus TaxID=48021 RepID=A0ACB8T5A3_9AGAM|nr:glycoside hydrolase [Artomyces pyxidatus]
MVTITEEIKREIGQHFVVGFHGYEASENIEVLIRQYYLGNVILMKRNVRSAQQVHSVVQRLQQIARDAGHEMPLMIGTDQENGLVSAFSLEATDEAGTQFPGAMALAATGSPDLAERVSAASARELKFAGINWTYSPVADVNSDSRNPVIGIRSFGDDAHEVSIYAAAVSRGLTSSGVAPCPKHFPGHGDTHVDSHLALPVIPKTLVQLSQIELVPFQALANEAATIMTGHMALPRITGDDTPASLARAATHGLLRESLHYDGVIVTDCLEMEAVAARPGGVSAAAVDALRAGADIVMICHRFARHVASFEAVYEAVASGTLDVAELRASGQRIAKLKAAFAGTWTQAADAPFVSADWRALKAQNKLLSHEAYAASIAVVQDPQSTLPLPKAGPVVVFTPRMESLNLAVDDADGILRTADGQLRNTAGPSYVAFARNVRDRIGTGAVHAVYVPMDGLSAEHEEQLRSASAIVFATRNADRSSWQLDYLRKVLRVRKDNVVVLGSCAPYDLLALGKDDELRSVTYVVSFEFTATALTAAAAVIFGDAQAAGRVPVCGGKVVG